ncbi:L-lactate dehydrogenase-like [Sycon ciliatum]|uniref:L-lactate dehydrogenase-like n=1 Tax=Sycon ciliatum TaxID=27933 RepID=UPI0020ACEBE5|eukprot:scpid69996/ scgid11047/ L-lactate dehydrogenase
MAESLASQLFRPVEATTAFKPVKVTVVGVGAVGMACAFSLVQQGLVSELALVDIDKSKMEGEVLDLQHGMVFTSPVKVTGSPGPESSAGSDLVIITAGVRQREGEPRLSLVQRNVNIYKSLIPKLVELSPDTLFLVVSNPVDVLTYVTWKLSGLPAHRVFGSGTNLDSSRFRVLLAERLDVAPSSVHGWVIGEHGDSSVPVWSGVNVAGVPFKQVCPTFGTPDDPEKWIESHKQVVDGAYEVIRLKGYTCWAIGLSVANLTQCIFRNEKKVVAISTLVKGLHGVEDDVFLSVPCVLGRQGLDRMVVQSLTEEERANVLKSAKTLHEVQESIQF